MNCCCSCSVHCKTGRKIRCCCSCSVHCKTGRRIRCCGLERCRNGSGCSDGCRSCCCGSGCSGCCTYCSGSNCSDDCTYYSGWEWLSDTSCCSMSSWVGYNSCLEWSYDCNSVMNCGCSWESNLYVACCSWVYTYPCYCWCSSVHLKAEWSWWSLPYWWNAVCSGVYAASAYSWHPVSW